MADRAGIAMVDRQALRIAPKPQPSSKDTSVTAFAFLPHHAEQSQTLCPNCRNQFKHAESPLNGAISTAEVKEEDLGLVCYACGQELASSNPLRQNAATDDPRSRIEFVSVHEPSGKLDKPTGTQVRAYVMRRYHQARRKSQTKQSKTSERTNKYRLTPRTGACPHDEACDFQNAGLNTILGSGRSDPFLSLSIPDVPWRYHELIDYCVTVLWPGLRGFNYSVAYTRAWLPVASQNATVLNVFLFTASLHLETLRGPGTLSRKKIRTEQLHQKGEAIRGINDALFDPKYCQSDELIRNILFLAMNENGEEEELPDPSPFIAPLQNVQWLGVYGTRRYVMSHVTAVQEMIRRRGGIRNIKSVGLPWLISFSELIYCAATLSKPQHPLLDPFGRDIVYQRLRIPLDMAIDRSATHRSNQGFHYLQASGMRPEVIGIFLNLKDYSEAVEAYSNSVILPDCVPDDRNWLLHRLLSLPAVGATDLLSKIDVLSKDFYCGMLNCEACRLTAVMYCIHATFPVPRSIYARRILLPQMKESIGKIHLAAGHQALRELVLWCVVVGGIAASGPPERSWFAAQLFTVSTFLDLKQWSDARAVLRKFAWLDAACNTGGSAFWDEVFWPSQKEKHVLWRESLSQAVPRPSRPSTRSMLMLPRLQYVSSKRVRHFGAPCQGADLGYPDPLGNRALERRSTCNSSHFGLGMEEAASSITQTKPSSIISCSRAAFRSIWERFGPASKVRPKRDQINAVCCGIKKFSENTVSRSGLNTINHVEDCLTCLKHGYLDEDEQPETARETEFSAQR